MLVRASVFRLPVRPDAVAARPGQVLGFRDAGPGASPGPGLPLRVVQLAVPATAVRNMLAFVRAQRSPYLAALARIGAGSGGRPC